MQKKLKLEDAAVKNIKQDVERQEDVSFVGYSYPANEEDADREAEYYYYTTKIGDNSGLPNANGDIMDYSNANLNVVTSETTTIDNTGGYILGSSGGLSPIGGSASSIYTWPQQSGSASTISIQTPQTKYAILDLPRDDISPTSVFVCGRMVTLGVIGTDVECAFMGDKLIFEPGVINSISYQGRITVSVEYRDEIYHYNVGSEGIVDFVNEGTLLDADLVSTIEK